MCGGTIYDASHVITAAHCCEGNYPYKILVVVGEHELYDGDDVSVAYNVSRILINPYYNSLTFKHDICLLTLRTPMEFTQ